MPNRDEDGIWIKYTEGTKANRKRRDKAWYAAQKAIEKLAKRAK